MPWKVARGHGCPKSKPWAVVKETTGEKIACHATRAKAAAQVRALYANEKHSIESEYDEHFLHLYPEQDEELQRRLDALDEEFGEFADAEFSSSDRSLPFDVPFTEAAAIFKSKIPLTRDEFDALADWAKTRAFTVATVTKAEILQDMMDAVQQAIADGLTFADFQELLGDIMEARGWAGLDPWHAETVFRTNIQSAYGAGRWQQQRAQREDFPFLQYHAINDTRVRPTHWALNGIVQPIGAPFWKHYYPPWDYNCRCDAESLSADEARAIGIAPVNVIDVGIADDFTSPAAGDWEPDLRGLDPVLRDAVTRARANFDPRKTRD